MVENNLVTTDLFVPVLKIHVPFGRVCTTKWCWSFSAKECCQKSSSSPQLYVVINFCGMIGESGAEENMEIKVLLILDLENALLFL